MIAWLVGMDGDDGIIVSLLAYRDSFIPSNPARVQGSCFVSLLKFSCLGQNHSHGDSLLPPWSMGAFSRFPSQFQMIIITLQERDKLLTESGPFSSNETASILMKCAAGLTPQYLSVSQDSQPL